MEGAAIDHVVLGVDLEEAEVGGGVEDRPEMLGLEAQAAARGQGTGHERQ